MRALLGGPLRALGARRPVARPGAIRDDADARTVVTVPLCHPCRVAVADAGALLLSRGDVAAWTGAGRLPLEPVARPRPDAAGV